MVFGMENGDVERKMLTLEVTYNNILIDQSINFKKGENSHVCITFNGRKKETEKGDDSAGSG
jgi:hypothetical protein